MSRLFAILFLFSQLQSGNDLFDKDQYADAVAAYENIPAAERTAAIQNRLGISYHLLNKLKEAEAAYRDAIKRDPKFADAYNNLGALYYSRRSFGQAERQFRQALETDAENTAARKNLRAVRYARENGRRSTNAALEAEKLKPMLVDERSFDAIVVTMLLPAKDIEEASMHEKRADSFMARKMYDDAIVEYSKAMAIDKYNASTVNRLGLAYHQSQRIKEAEVNYREALKLNPYYVEAFNNVGTIEFLKKNYDKALDEYKKALKLRPESSTILHNVGACLFAMERFEEGMEVYRHALRIDPQLFEHITGFGTIIQTTSRNDSIQNFYLAKMFAGVGDKDRAISLLYKAYEDGFKDVDKIKKDPAFSDLLDDERFQRLMQTMGSNQNGSGNR
jgi:tetratricopeptide (TPR) repeat protein